jgi:hypothetical protein
VIKDSYLVTPLLAKFIEFGIWLVVYLNGSQDEEDNLDDVRGTQLTNAMKEMDIGDIRPK